MQQAMGDMQVPIMFVATKTDLAEVEQVCDSEYPDGCFCHLHEINGLAI